MNGQVKIGDVEGVGGFIAAEPGESIENKRSHPTWMALCCKCSCNILLQTIIKSRTLKKR